MLNAMPPLKPIFFKCHLVENKVSSLTRGEKVKTTAIWEYDASNQSFPWEKHFPEIFDVTNPGKVLLEPRGVDQRGKKGKMCPTTTRWQLEPGKFFADVVAPVEN